MLAVRKNEAGPGPTYDCIWPGDDEVSHERAMCIMSPQVLDPDGCVMGYDIECTSEYKGLPSPSDPITMLSVWCSCGFSWLGHTLVNHRDKEEYYGTVTGLVDALVAIVVCHSPQWLVGYNNFAFDNPALYYHSSLKHYFRQVRMPRPSLACTIEVPAVVNCDAYAFLDKTQRGSYSSMRLDVVARQLGLGGKTRQVISPGDTHEDFRLAADYNLNDSRLASLVWSKTSCCHSVTALCKVFACRPTDAVRYNTGVMTSCMMAHRLTWRGKVMDWRECDAMPYQGGLVLQPALGHHRHVAVLDFASMYPSVMCLANISHETIRQQRSVSLKNQGAVVWTDSCIAAVHEDRVAMFPREPLGVIPEAMAELVRERRATNKADPLNWALKVGANSLYGAMGFEHSGLYSPVCAASVTLISRWALTATECIAVRMGARVVYGDTDSIMIVGYRDEGLPDYVCATVGLVLSYAMPPTNGMAFTLQHEKTYQSMVVFGPKQYLQRTYEGNVIPKGIHLVRKDRAPLIGDCVAYLCECLCETQSNIDCAFLCTAKIEERQGQRSQSSQRPPATAR
ncbi:hypothetical protein CYMTET_32403 [Cymbomonas tetramitiformis]|uniref:DNA polymerase n=1 Tax=Cymbomonas tetramitiformis TaxID=36881 RepID=A0AAE0KS86_9CHLO|nr:hypothetical protein CYMTET_32403 [Cymbomonas tetramitiformis]